MTISRRAALVTLVLGLSASTGLIAASGELRLKTRLAGGAIGGLTPSGAAEFRARSGQQRFTAEVEDVNLPAGTRLNVYVNSTQVGQIVLSGAPTRGGDLNLDTRDGDAVPQLRKSDFVTVLAGDGAVLAGTL